MDWEEMVEERARSRRRLIGLLSAMLAGDFVAALGVTLGYIRLLDWLVAVPFIVLGLGTAGYTVWRIFFRDRAGQREDPK